MFFHLGEKRTAIGWWERQERLLLKPGFCNKKVRMEKSSFFILLSYMRLCPLLSAMFSYCEIVPHKQFQRGQKERFHIQKRVETDSVSFPRVLVAPSLVQKT